MSFEIISEIGFVLCISVDLEERPLIENEVILFSDFVKNSVLKKEQRDFKSNCLFADREAIPSLTISFFKE